MPESADLLLWWFGDRTASIERSRYGELLERRALYPVRPDFDETQITAWPSKAHRKKRSAMVPLQDVMAEADQLSAQNPEAYIHHSIDAGRRLARVRAEEYLLYRALELYYGCEGDLWARDQSNRGRWVALYQITPAGAELIRQIREAAADDAREQTDTQLLRAELTNTDSERAGLISEAQRQAVLLEQRAREAWEQSDPERPTAPAQANVIALPLPRRVADQRELLMTAREVAECLSWTPEKARNRLKRAGADMRPGPHGPQYAVTEHVLRRDAELRQLADRFVQLQARELAA